MEQNDIFTMIFSSNIAYIGEKIIAVSLLLLHVAFSLILLKQTQKMIKVVEADISPTILLISVIHFAASVGVLVFAIILI